MSELTLNGFVGKVGKHTWRFSSLIDVHPNSNTVCPFEHNWNQKLS